MQHVPALKEICHDVAAVRNGGFLRQMKALPALAKGLPLSVGMFASRELTRWIDHKIASTNLAGAFVYSSAMSQFINHTQADDLPVIMDFVDVDSEKWLQYAKNKKGLARWLYNREGKTLLTFDKDAAHRASRSLLVSEPETELFKSLVPDRAETIFAVPNGIDLDFFSPGTQWASPYKTEGPHFVFTGSMDYWPNVDAVTWFTEEIFPNILARHPTSAFHIVGARPTSQVRALTRHEAVHVTGKVDKVQPYLAHATAAVAPLRIARGIQNKVLEAMAMGKATIVTSDALEGIKATREKEVLLANNCDEFVRAAEVLVEQGRASEIGQNARKRAERDFGWAAQLEILDSVSAKTWKRSQ